MPARPHTILVATDLSARSDRPMERALLLGDQLQALVLILHVHSGEAPLASEEAQKLRDHIEREFDFSDHDVEILLEYGSVPDVIAEVADRRNCTLVVTGVARFNSPRDYFLGTAVDYLVRRSPAPVLVVKRRARRAYQRLLVATDFSDCSVLAARTAGTLFPEAILRVVHSFHAAFEGLLDRESTIDFIRDECDQFMKRLVDSLPENVQSRVETANDEGHLGKVIADEVRDWGADLLVVGSHGHSGFAHATIGDTAAGLLKSADCDVLVVREK